jgi:cytochrome c556
MSAMIRKLLRCVVVASLGFIGVIASYGAASSADDKLPDIGEIMKKGHAKSDGYLAKIRGEAKDGKWEDATKDAKSLVILGDALGKNKPPKGDAKSWETLTKKYSENTMAVSKGVEAKDVKAVNTALGAIGVSCKECHSAHKP